VKACYIKALIVPLDAVSLLLAGGIHGLRPDHPLDSFVRSQWLLANL